MPLILKLCGDSISNILTKLVWSNKLIGETFGFTYINPQGFIQCIELTIQLGFLSIYLLMTSDFYSSSTKHELDLDYIGICVEPLPRPRNAI